MLSKNIVANIISFLDFEKRKTKDFFYIIHFLKCCKQFYSFLHPLNNTDIGHINFLNEYYFRAILLTKKENESLILLTKRMLKILNPEFCNNCFIKLSCLNGHTEVVKLLLNDGRADLESGIVYALRANNYDIFSLLLSDMKKRYDIKQKKLFFFQCFYSTIEKKKLLFQKKESLKNIQSIIKDIFSLEIFESEIIDKIFSDLFSLLDFFMTKMKYEKRNWETQGCFNLKFFKSLSKDKRITKEMKILLAKKIFTKEYAEYYKIGICILESDEQITISPDSSLVYWTFNNRRYRLGYFLVHSNQIELSSFLTKILDNDRFVPCPKIRKSFFSTEN